MKHLSEIILSFIIIYSGYGLYQSPNIANSIITLGFCATFCYLKYLNYLSNQVQSTDNKNDEIKELEHQLKLEKLQENIEHFRYESANRKARRDENSLSKDNNKKILF